VTATAPSSWTTRSTICCCCCCRCYVNVVVVLVFLLFCRRRQCHYIKSISTTALLCVSQKADTNQSGWTNARFLEKMTTASKACSQSYDLGIYSYNACVG
jgi:hypothetical protein